jgi:hypothetical protein
MAMALVALMVAEGCGRPPLLVEGPMDLGTSAAVERFEKAVRIDFGERWEICFEFDHSGDSHAAGGIQAVLLAASGQRYPMTHPELDRRGEAIVCHIARLDAMEAGGRLPTSGEVWLEAVELSSAKSLRLRRIRGGSGS